MFQPSHPPQETPITPYRPKKNPQSIYTIAQKTIQTYLTTSSSLKKSVSNNKKFTIKNLRTINKENLSAITNTLQKNITSLPTTIASLKNNAL